MDREDTRDRLHLRPTIVAVAVATTVFVGLIPSPVRATPRPARAHTRIEIGADAWQLFRATNASRGRFGVPKLTLNREMSEVARRHSLAMARAGDLFHTGDAGVYLDGISWHAWGENVGFTPWDVESMQVAFMKSPSHRTNILNRGFRHLAIGAVRVDGVLWVTVFFYS
jgi:uncharacterized protein YkwD